MTPRRLRALAAGIVVLLLALLLAQVLRDDAPAVVIDARPDAVVTLAPDGGMRDPVRRRRHDGAPEPGADATDSTVEESVPDRSEACVIVRVVDEEGRPVSEAVVILAPREEEPGPLEGNLFLHSNGTWPLLVAPSPGPWDLFVSSFGYVPYLNRELDGESLPSSIDVTLRRGLSLTGRVVDTSGNGFEGAVVWAFGPRTDGVHAMPWRMLRRRTADVGTTRSGPDGRFTLTGLRDVPYHVTAKHGGLRTVALPRETAPQDHRPGEDVTLLLAESWAVAIAFHDEAAGRLADIAELDLGTPRVEGVPEGVLEAAGEPEFADWRPSAMSGNLARWFVARATVDGTPELVFDVRSLRYEPIEVRVPLELWVDRPRARQVLLHPRRGLTGRLTVTLSDTDAIEFLGAYDLLLRQAGTGRWSRLVVRPEPTGRASFDLPKGTYEWTGSARGGAGRSDPQRIEIFANGETPLRLSVPAASVAALTLRVVDQDGADVPGAAWRLESATEPGRRHRIAGGIVRRTAPIERIDGIPSGDYVVIANARGADVVERRVTLPGGAVTDLEVVLELR